MHDNGNFNNVYWEIDRDNGVIHYAEEMQDDYPSWGDMCSGTAVIDVRERKIINSDWTIDSNYNKDVEVLQSAQRAIKSFEYQNNGGNNYNIVEELDLWEMVEKVALRTRIHVYGVVSGYYETTVSDDLENADYLCFVHGDNKQDYHGREFAAMCNGYRWSVYTCPLERLELWISDNWGDLEDFDYRLESNDSCHGYTWENIDASGESTPAAGELSERL